MKTLHAYFLILVAVFSACNGEPEIALTPDLVEELHAYDLDNNGNASDIRVDFVVKDNLNVLEYRVMVVPEDQKDSFAFHNVGAINVNILQTQESVFR